MNLLVQAVADSTEVMIGGTDGPGVIHVDDIAIEPVLCPGDVTADSTVNIDDLMAVITGWGTCVNSNCPADVNFNGIVNIDDLMYVITGWGGCP